MSAPTQLLRQVPLFKGLPRAQLETLARSLHARTFTQGSDVTTEGERGIGFFVIESGTARVLIGGDERRMLGPGDYFGEMALIDDKPRTATIVADTDLKCWGLTAWEFRPLVESNAQIAWSLLQTLAERLRES